jgi:Immunity protein 52
MTLMPSSNSGGTAASQLPDMATDHWTMTGQWATRPEDEVQCAERLVRFLEGIGSLHPSLGRWLFNGRPVKLNATTLAGLMRRDEEFAEHGCKIGLWNGAADRATEATIMVNCGVTASYAKSSITLALPQPAGAPELYELETMRTFLERTVSMWDLAWCSVRPYGLLNSSDRGSSVAVFASWMAYLDNSLITRVRDLPGGVSTFDSGQGRLFVMAPTPAELTLDVVHSVARSVELDPAWKLS